MLRVEDADAPKCDATARDAIWRDRNSIVPSASIFSLTIYMSLWYMCKPAASA